MLRDWIEDVIGRLKQLGSDGASATAKSVARGGQNWTPIGGSDLGAD
jgi:hypothetical protein